MKSVRLWATTTPEVYQTLLLYLAQTIDKNGKKVKIGELLTESKIESLDPRSDKRIKVRLNVKGVEKRAEKNEVEGAVGKLLQA